MSVFQLKYRPLNLSDLDLKSVSASLEKLVLTNDFPQALLFSGPKGSGKTSAARIVARILNCENINGVIACGKCPSCLEILQGNSLDVVEIDAASNRGIDEARSLKDRAYLSPARLKKKVFVVDEVHMMTRDAFNALLKLLEEPPKQTIFILCTTDEEKIPDTVLSRLVKVKFEKGKEIELIKSLRRIVQGEKLEVDDEVFQIVVQNCDGSFRNLHKLFNEICIELDGDISAAKVVDFFNKRNGDYSLESLEHDLAKGEIKKILSCFESMASQGVDFKIYRERQLAYFQNKLLSVYGVVEDGVSLLTADRLEKLLQLLIVAGRLESDSTIPQLALELAVVEFLSGGGGQQINYVEKPPETSTVLKTELKGPDRETRKLNASIKVNFGIDKIVEGWGSLLTAVKPYNHSVEAFLRAVRPIKLDGNIVICDVYYPFHKDKLEEQKNRGIVEKGLAEVFGVELMFECVLAKSKQEPIVVKNDTPVEEVTSTVASGDEMYDVAKQIFG